MYLPLAIPYVVVTDPNVAKHILQTNSKNYERPPLKGMGVFRRLVGESSVLLTNGETHKNQRALVSPAFSPSNIRQLIPLMIECGTKLLDRLAEMADSDRLIDVRRELNKCTLDIIGKTGFGYDFHCLDQKNSESDVDDDDDAGVVVGA